MTFDQAVCKDKRQAHRKNLATYIAFVIAVLVCGVCFTYFTWMLDIWRQPQSATCQGLCGDVWQYGFFGGGTHQVGFWQPFYLMYEITVIVFLLCYMVFRLECRIATVIDDAQRYQKFWWWRGGAVFLKILCVGYGLFFVLMGTVGYFVPYYMAAFAIVLDMVQTALLLALLGGCLIAAWVFTRLWVRRQEITSAVLRELIWSFVTVSGMAVTAFSILSFPK